jgi:hypothetical protein
VVGEGQGVYSDEGGELVETKDAADEADGEDACGGVRGEERRGEERVRMPVRGWNCTLATLFCLK